jgi:hypothetical protein
MQIWSNEEGQAFAWELQVTQWSLLTEFCKWLTCAGVQETGTI